MFDPGLEAQEVKQQDDLPADLGAEGDRTGDIKGQAMDDQIRSVAPTGSVMGKTNEVAAAREGLQGGAQSLPHQAAVEARIGRSLDGVKAFTGVQANDAARSVGANAFAIGNQIAFATATPDVDLVEHEARHVVQQAGMGPGAAMSSNVAHLESEARGETGALSASPVALMKDETTLLDDARIQRAITYNLSKSYGATVWTQVQQNIGTAVTGTPDRKTILAVAAWQKDSGLTVDGMVGPASLGKLGVSTDKPSEQGETEMVNTFSDESIAKMRGYFEDNAMSSKPAPCITAMNRGIAKLYGERQPAGSTVQDTMGKMDKDGTVSSKQIIDFLDAKGRKTTGVREPEKPSQSPSGYLHSMVGDEPGWHVFGMSIMDGYHSITISVDNRDPADKKIYWSDQWRSNGGFKLNSAEEFDQKLADFTKSWWNKYKNEKGYPPRSRLTFWKLQAPKGT